ncbi:MAG TPA: fumarylacetoacetate hydrolase family protein [Usitatibacter sp.]|nr:fumarylacetoacetate hydrolase family protein [Usitatibacter sp.]
MRLARFNEGRLGLVEGDSVLDITDWAFSASPFRTDDPLLAFIHIAQPGVPEVATRHALRDVVLDAPLRRPGKIIAAAANYWKHTQEMNPGRESLGGIREKGFFLKAPSSLVGHGGTVRLPFADRRTDQEAELAVVIARGGRDIPASRALEHVFGYACLLDITVRGKEDRGLRKSFDTFTPLGPWVTTSDEVPDPMALDIACRVNGEERQHDTTRSMIMAVPELLEWISQVMTLEPGDVIATGTPAGVGPLQPGDRVEVAIERLGTLAVSVSAR